MMKRFAIECKNKKPLVPNPIYNKLTMRINRLKKKMSTLSDKDLRNAKHEYVKTIKDRRRIKSIIPNPLVSRIKYVRFADD
jgi:preprotein translocase subunit SecA